MPNPSSVPSPTSLSQRGRTRSLPAGTVCHPQLANLHQFLERLAPQCGLDTKSNEQNPVQEISETPENIPRRYHKLRKGVTFRPYALLTVLPVPSGTASMLRWHPNAAGCISTCARHPIAFHDVLAALPEHMHLSSASSMKAQHMKTNCCRHAFFFTRRAPAPDSGDRLFVGSTIRYHCMVPVDLELGNRSRSEIQRTGWPLPFRSAAWTSPCWDKRSTAVVSGCLSLKTG